MTRLSPRYLPAARFLFTAVPAFVYFAARMPDLAESAPAVIRRAAALVLPIWPVAAGWSGPAVLR